MGETDEKHMNAMHACLTKECPSSLGVIPLSLLYMAPILQLDAPFVALFNAQSSKHSLNSAVNGFWPKLSHKKLYQETVRWNGDICICSATVGRRLRSNKCSKTKQILTQCDLVSIDMHRRNKKCQNMNENVLIYDMLSDEKTQIFIDGVMEQNVYRNMEHLPYICLVIRPTNANDTRLQELILSTKGESNYFIVKFGENNEEIKGVMHAILPTFVMIRIYTKLHWQCPSAAIDKKFQTLTLCEPDLTGKDHQKLEKICDANLQIGKHCAIKFLKTATLKNENTKRKKKKKKKKKKKS